jgi:hypothetical protein
MKLTGYTNPIRSMERRLAPDYAQREFHDPGLRSMRSTGLGSLHHTMPHLRRMTAGATRLQGGGTINPVGQIYAASRPNLYNPDPMRRRVLDAMRQMPMINRQLTAFPGSGMQFPYAGGGAVAPPDPEDLMNPEDQQSAPDDADREVVLEAMAALEGQARDPEEAIAHFIDVFGPRALADLQHMVEAKHRQEQQGGGEEEEEEDESQGGGGGGGGQEEEEEPDLMAGAGGGLLNGPGTGQSDEIAGETPSGRPVLLSDGEYVFDAPTVAALGDGSTSAGARRLDALRKQIRKDAWGHDEQAKPMAKGGKALVLRIP